MDLILKENELDKLIEKLPKKNIILLSGEMASGKTTLAKKIINKNNFEFQGSPTFQIIKYYENQNIKIAHIDAYNIKDSYDQEIIYALENYKCIIEWPMNIKKSLSDFKNDIINIEIINQENNKRKYKISW